MQAAFKRKQRNLSIVLAVLCAGITAVALALHQQLETANWWVSHTLTVMQESNQSLLCLMDCETAYRGYLITGASEYLAPYEHCYREVESHVETVSQLTKDNPRQQALVPELKRLALEKVKFSQKVIEARRANRDKLNWPSGSSLINIDTGRTLMDKFRAITEQMQDEERRLLLERQQRAQIVFQAAFVSILLMCIAIVASAYWIAAAAAKFSRTEAEAIESITKARDQAIQSNLLKSQFVANVSHEIRTPLSGMLGVCELLSLADTATDTKELSVVILDSGRKLMKLINDLLDFSKLESGKFTLLEEDFSIELLLHEIANVMRPLAEEHDDRLIVSTDKSVEGSFVGDSYRIRQVLLNLVNNGIKFTSHGEVTVSAHVTQESKDSVSVRFDVKDTGIGITPDQLSQLFVPYAQADRFTAKIYGGTGLGLSISKKLAELMNGSLNCQSEKDKGSTFWFTVPLKRSAVQQTTLPTLDATQ